MDDGKRLAQTPHKPLTFYERIRLEKQQKASIETPLVQGYRLLPEFTPGRAMFWGTVLAMWGTAAVVMSTAKSLDIHTVSDNDFLKCLWSLVHMSQPVSVSFLHGALSVKVDHTLMHADLLTDAPDCRGFRQIARCGCSLG